MNIKTKILWGLLVCAPSLTIASDLTLSDSQPPVQQLKAVPIIGLTWEKVIEFNGIRGEWEGGDCIWIYDSVTVLIKNSSSDAEEKVYGTYDVKKFFQDHKEEFSNEPKPYNITYTPGDNKATYKWERLDGMIPVNKPVTVTLHLERVHKNQYK